MQPSSPLISYTPLATTPHPPEGHFLHRDCFARHLKKNHPLREKVGYPLEFTRYQSEKSTIS